MTVFSSVGAAKTRRMGRIFAPDGKSVFAAVDHAAYISPSPPLGRTMHDIADGGPDGVLATWHIAREYADAFARTGLVLRIDGGTTELGGFPEGDVSTLLYQVEDAVRIGADSVVLLVFIGQHDEHRSLTRLGQVVREAEQYGLPVMAEVIPGGWGRAVEWNIENVALGARIAAEFGADIVKTVSPTAPEEFARVVEACPVPVVALGGPKTNSEDDVVALAAGVTAAGAAGVAFGRNVWGSPDPAALIRRLSQAVHG